MSTILNTPSSNHSLYIESHYKKFWLRKSETELKLSNVSTPQVSKPLPLVSTSTAFHTGPRNSTAKDKGCTSLWESPRKVGKAEDNCYPSSSLWSISESGLSIAPLSRSLVAAVDRQCFDQIQEEEKPLASTTDAELSPLSEESGRRAAAKAVLSLPDNAEEQGATGDEQRCTRCGTNKTPMWRSGPFGHKTLCNACGIRYKKFKSKSSILSEEQQKNEGQHSPRFNRSPSFLTTSAKRKMDYHQSSVSQPLHSPKRAKLSDLVERASSKSAISAYQISKDVAGNHSNSSVCSGKKCYPFAKDEEEGAALLMALSSSSFA